MSIGIPKRATLTGLVLVLVATACSSGDSPRAATGPETPLPVPSVALETFQGDGFEMLLPAEWLVATPSDPNIGALLGDDRERFPPANVEALEQQVADLFRHGGRLFAFDVVNPHPDVVDNINIIFRPGGDVPSARVESVTVRELQIRLGARAIESEIRAVPAGEAVIISYRLPSSGIEGVSVTLLTESGHWALSLTMKELGPMKDDFVTMADSFREQP